MFLKRIENALILSLIFVVCLLGGCGTRSEEGKEASGEQDSELPESLATSAEYSLWETILGEYGDGMFRGVSFGDSREKVRITETFELFEDLPGQMGYTYDTRELETVDVSYQFSEEQLVSGIVVDIFLNRESSADRLWEIATWYFNREYGPVSESPGSRRVWENGIVRIDMENVSSGIDHGLKITFSRREEGTISLVTPAAKG